MSDDILDKFGRDRKAPEVIVEEPAADSGPDIFSKFDRAPPEIIKEKGKPTKVIIRTEPRSIAQAKGEFVNRAVSSIPILGPLAQKAVAGGMALVEGGINRLTGKPADIAGNYDNSLQTQGAMAESYGANHPLMATGADIAGSSALLGPLSGTAAGARMMGLTGTSLGTKVLQGAGGMGVVETANQLMRGHDPRDQGFTGPVPLAAVGGAAGPILGEAISAGGNKLLEMMPRTSGPLAGTNTITRNKLTDALEGESPASIVAAKNAHGSSGMLMDTNQGTRDIAGGLADIPGPHKGEIRETLRQRAAGQADRLMTSLDRNTVPQVKVADLVKTVENSQSAEAKPLYDQFRTMRVQPTKEIKDLLPRLEKAGAFKLADELSGISGRQMEQNFFTGGPQKAFPTAEAWDYVKRGLDRRISSAIDGGDKELYRELVKLKSDMLGEIGKTPAGKVWEKARQTFAEHAEIKHQIEEGQKTFSRATRSDDLAQELSGLSYPERAARQQGARDAIQQIIDNSVRGDTTARNTLLTRAGREKLNLLFGDKKAGRLINDLEAELNVSKNTNEIVGGSPTSSKQARRNELLPQKSEPGYLRNIDLTHPASLVPDWMTPQAMMEGAASARHGAAHQQLADLMRVRMKAPEFDHLVTEIMNEGARRSAMAGKFDRVGSATSQALQTIGPALRNRLLGPPEPAQ
jgi:hypothetical protein